MTIYTTEQAAKLCGVSGSMIRREFDAGALRGFRVPGSTFRRVPRANLLRWMLASGIPLVRLGPLNEEERGIVAAHEAKARGA